MSIVVCFHPTNATKEKIRRKPEAHGQVGILLIRPDFEVQMLRRADDRPARQRDMEFARAV